MRSGLLQANDRFLQPVPLHHVYPFVNGLLTPLAFGLPVIFPGGLTGSALARALRDGGATVTIGVPRLYQAFSLKKAGSGPATSPESKLTGR